MTDHIAAIAASLQRIAAVLENQAAQAREQQAKFERFEANRRKLLQMIDQDKRFAGLFERAQSCAHLTVEVIAALVERPDPVLVLNEIVMRSTDWRKLAWMDEAAVAAEIEHIERRLALAPVALAPVAR